MRTTDAQVRKLMEEMSKHGKVGRAALRAGSMLATTDRKTTTPSHRANPSSVIVRGMIASIIACPMMRSKTKLMGKESTTAAAQLIRPIIIPSTTTDLMISRSTAPTAFSFTGATSQRRLLKEAAPQWAERLKQHRVDAVLLVPV